MSGYEAKRYARSGKGPHTCPDGYGHDLIPDGVLWVCPYALDRERGEALAARWEAEAEEARHERARAIARSTPLPAAWRAGVDMSDALQAEIVAYGEACALRAMNEYRGDYSASEGKE